MEVLDMTDKELITITMDRYAELQRIKRDNGGHENKELVITKIRNLIMPLN